MLNSNEGREEFREGDWEEKQGIGDRVRQSWLPKAVDKLGTQADITTQTGLLRTRYTPPSYAVHSGPVKRAVLLRARLERRSSSCSAAVPDAVMRLSASFLVLLGVLASGSVTGIML